MAISCICEDLLQQGQDLVQNKIPSALITTSLTHSFEYLGIQKVWELGQRSTIKPHNHIILYFHAKGMSDPLFPNSKLINTILKPWKMIIDRFIENQKLNKAGYACAKPGWIWYNFWWARASYIKKLVKPIKTQRQNYYEEWLGRLQPNDLTIKNDGDNEETGVFISNPDGLSLFSKNTTNQLGATYDPIELN